MINANMRVYALQHLETKKYICLLQNGKDYLACFSNGDSAIDFRESLNMREHVDLSVITIEKAPFNYFYLDGENIHVDKSRC